MSNGKFIKKGSKLLEVIKIAPYSFDEISVRKLLVPDNIQSNVIHSRYHSEEDLDAGLIDPSSFKEDLERPKKPIQFPIDFTSEWEEAKRRSIRPKEHDDDEEEYEKYLQSLENKELSAEADAEAAKKKSRREISAFDDIKPTPDESNATESDKLKDLQSTEFSPKNPIEIVKDAFSKLKSNASDPEIQKPEAPPLDTPKAHVTEDSKEKIALNDADFKELQEKAKTLGYKEGLGETLKLSKKLGEIIHAFESLKKNVLSNIQDNFYEIVKALSQTIFEKEIAASPETFAKIIKKTVASLVDNDKFTVHLNPNDFYKLSSLNVDNLTNNLVSDPNITEGNFQIETDLGTVDTGLKDIIKQLLEQTNLSLFDKEKDSDG